MKKLIYLTLAAAIMGSVSSCKHEEADIFDDTAANRLEQFKEKYSKIFTDKGGKWALEYFANSTEPGYVFVVTFNENNSVEIAGNNKWLGGSDVGGSASTFATDNSMWGIVSDDGPVLTFNTYNKVFHLFSSPANIPGGPTYSDGEKEVDVDETGKGHEGDYEFVIMGVDESDQIVTLQGKKRGYKAYLRRLPADTDDREYLQKVYENSHENVCTEFGSLLLHDTKTNRRFTITEVSESYMQGHVGLFEAYPQGGDSIQQTVSQNAIVTYDGLRFRHDFEVPLPYSDEVITINSFAFQPDGSLLGVSNPNVVLRAPMLSDIVRNGSVEVGKKHVWDLSEYNLGDKETLFNTVCEALETRFSGKRNFNGFGITAANVNTVPTPSIFLTFGTIRAHLYLNITRVDDNTIRIEPSELKEGNFNTLVKTVPEAADLLNAFEGTYTLEADDIMRPFAIRWVGDNGISFTANLKR